jgi:molybdopterin/thiamine biosynthesis adenylyltransferase
MGRYERNAPAISQEEQNLLAAKRVLVAGCGGLGGYIVELLARTGVGNLTVVDGDVFADSNLNRQLFSTAETLGQPKPLCAVRRIAVVNGEVNIVPVCSNITEQNADQLLRGQDIAVDALDNGASRIILAAAARKAGYRWSAERSAVGTGAYSCSGRRIRRIFFGKGTAQHLPAISAARPLVSLPCRPPRR